MVPLQCVCYQISTEVLGNTFSHISYTCMLSLQCEFSQAFEGIRYKLRLSYTPISIWLLSSMSSHYLRDEKAEVTAFHISTVFLFQCAWSHVQ